MQKRLIWMTAAMAGGVLFSQLAAAAEEVAAKGKQETELVGGLTLNDGNSENSQLNVGIATKGTYGQNEMMAGAEYNYGDSTVDNADGTTTSETTTENAKGDAQFNHLFSERTYGLLTSSFLYDDIADIDYRVVVGVGLGRYLVKTDASKLALEAGPGYLMERVGGEDNDAALLRLAQRGEHTFTSGAKVWDSVEYLPQFEDFDAYLVNSEVGLDATVTGDLSLRLVVQDRYASQPAEGRDNNDVSVTAGLVYKL